MSNKYSPVATNDDRSGSSDSDVQLVRRNNNYCYDLFGFEALEQLSFDAIILILCKGFRLFSFGFLAVMLVIYLSELRFSASEIGALFTWTLLGDAVMSIFLTSKADAMGRKMTLVIGSFLAIVTSFVAATQSNYYVILVAAIIGVISPSGNIDKVSVSLSRVNNNFNLF